jgi:hypothetical protein
VETAPTVVLTIPQPERIVSRQSNAAERSMDVLSWQKPVPIWSRGYFL